MMVLQLYSANVRYCEVSVEDFEREVCTWCLKIGALPKGLCC